MENYSTKIPRDYYYNQERKWELDDLEEDGNDSDASSVLLNDYRLIKISKFLIINSLDRNWSSTDSNETPYSFKVYFGNGTTTDHLNIPISLKNIVSIHISKLVIHNKQQDINYQTTLKETNNENPYLLVDLDGYNDTNNGTNKHIDSSTGIMITITPVGSTFSNFKSLEFKNINMSKKVFTSTPLSTLSYLNISIKDQLGEYPTKNIQDVIEIDGIVKSGAGSSEYLYIQTKTYFSTEYQTGDKIIIKNYQKIDKDSGNIVDTSQNAVQFNAFINRPEGHKIIELTNTNGTPIYKNLIKISKPFNISSSNGTLEDFTYFTSLGTMKTLDLADTSVQQEPGNNGKLINVNLQSHLFVIIETVEKQNIVEAQLI